MIFPRRGLYAISRTQAEFATTAQLLAEMQAVLRGGARVVQYRAKHHAPNDAQAAALLALCHAYNAPLIINDDLELAQRIGADGVHLGKEDPPISHARAVLGDQAIIGVSCYNAIELACNAQQLGASYVAFGRFYPSSSKPLALPAQLSTLQQAKTLLTVPIVAIGGILPSNAPALLNAGADLLAVIGGLFHSEPQSAAQAYQALFTDTLSHPEGTTLC